MIQDQGFYNPTLGIGSQAKQGYQFQLTLGYSECGVKQDQLEFHNSGLHAYPNF